MKGDQEIPILYHRIKDTYLLKKKIGKGSFGSIYSVENLTSKEQLAIKFEKVNRNNAMSTLLKEAKILYHITKKDLPGFPKITYFSKDPNYRWMIMSLLGRNIQKMMDTYNGMFSMGSSLKVTYQLVTRLKELHDLGYVHRDIKPENVWIGADSSDQLIYLIDFGLSKTYLDSSGAHIQIREKNGLVGTIRYTSVNSHLSIEQSRRDDLESLAYIMVYMLKGKLPWQGLLFFDDDTRMRKIAEMKWSITPEKLTEGLSPKLTTFVKHIKKLKFIEKPNYTLLQNLLKEVAEDNGINLDSHQFEWSKSASKNSNSKSKWHSLIDRNFAALTQSQQFLAVDENSEAGNKQQRSKAKKHTLNVLEIPNQFSINKTELNFKKSQDSGSHQNNQFYSRGVKLDSISNINSKDENIIINDLNGWRHDIVQVNSGRQSSSQNHNYMSGSKLTPLGELEEDQEWDPDVVSENYSFLIMDEQTASIERKIQITTLSSSKLISEIKGKLN